MELHLEHLTKRYGATVALDDVTVAFTPGIYGILGANGAGKSTLISLITDNVRRDSGSITFDGTDILTLGDTFRTRLGYMPQQQGLYEQMTAEGFLSYMARLKGLRGRVLSAQVDRVLELVNLDDVRHRKAGGFSGGMKQRLLLAQALLGNPQVLLLDEPTAGLDPRERVRIRDFIRELAQERIVLLATHIVTDIETIAHQVLLLKKGRLLRMDPPHDLVAALPAGWQPVTGILSLEDVYLHFLGE